MKHPKVTVDIQRVQTDEDSVPSDTQFRHWVKLALSDEKIARELTLRLVDAPEMTALNEQFRGKKGPTNVLSFPHHEAWNERFLGDIILCVPVIHHEAGVQKKEPMAHWAHIVIHGVLHLLGFDHIKPDEAEVMEFKEITLLKQMGFENPYE